MVSVKMLVLNAPQVTRSNLRREDVLRWPRRALYHNRVSGSIMYPNLILDESWTGVIREAAVADLGWSVPLGSLPIGTVDRGYTFPDLICAGRTVDL